MCSALFVTCCEQKEKKVGAANRIQSGNDGREKRSKEKGDERDKVAKKLAVEH